MSEAYDDLLQTAETVWRKAASQKLAQEPAPAPDLRVGDEVKVRIGAGSYLRGEVEEIRPDGVMVRSPNGRVKLYPLSVITNVTAQEEAERQTRRVREEEERRARKLQEEAEEQERLRIEQLSEQERLKLEEERRAKREAARARHAEQLRRWTANPGGPEQKYAEKLHRLLGHIPPEDLDTFAKYVLDNNGRVRVHFGENMRDYADFLFTQAGEENTIDPYIPGDKAGVTEMYGVSAEIHFSKPDHFNPADIPVPKYSEEETKIVIYNTALGFELIKRGVPYYGKGSPLQ